MKKFLTVLLVIAVMFTFSFGSAFAYTVTDATKLTLQETALDALNKALGNVDVLRNEYVRTVSTINVSYTAGGVTETITVKVSSIDGVGEPLDDAIQTIKDAITAEYNNQVMDINSGTVVGANVDEAKTNIKNAINGAYATYSTTLAVTGVLTSTEAFKKALVEAEVEAARADAIADIEAARATLGQYSDEVPSYVNVTKEGTTSVAKYMSNKAIAEALLNGAKKVIEGFDFDAATATDVKNAVSFWFDAVVAQVVTKDVDGNMQINYFDTYITVVDKAGTTLSGVIPTAADDEKGNKTLEEAKAYYISVAKGKAALAEAAIRKGLNFAAADKTNGLTTAQRAEYTEVAGNLTEYFAAVTEVFTAQINYAETEAEAKAYVESATQLTGLGHKGWGVEAGAFADAIQPTTGNLGDFTVAEVAETKAFFEKIVKVTEDVDALEALAAKKKASTGLNGNAAYDATAVDKALKADVKLAYTTYTAGTSLERLQPTADVVKVEMNKVLNSNAADTTVTLDKVVYPRVDRWTVNDTIFDDDNAEKAEAVIDETKAAIRAAKTVADVDAAFVEGYKAFDAVPTLEDQSKYQNEKATKEQITKYAAKLGAAFEAVKADYGTTKFAKDYDVNATTNLVNKLKAEYLLKAYDATDLEAKYQEALAVINGLKTEDELKAEAKAINEGILELGKKKLTSADEAAYLALVEKDEDLSDYVALIDAAGSYTTYGVEATLKATMQKLVKDDIDAAFKAIGTVDLDDEAAIDALDAQVAAYEENYATTYSYNGKVVDGLYAALTEAKIDAVEKAIGAINANVNPVDAAAVKAAREAYDALAEDGIYVDASMYAKLIALENTIEITTDENAKAYVQDLSIKARSTKTSKGVKVTIKADVQPLLDAGYTVEYKFYRSTKSNAKFGTAKVVKAENTYLNTSGKKGTRYYYKAKLVVKNAEGEVVATTPLTQCLYATRTF